MGFGGLRFRAQGFLGFAGFKVSGLGLSCFMFGVQGLGI